LCIIMSVVSLKNERELLLVTGEVTETLATRRLYEKGFKLSEHDVRSLIPINSDT